MVPLERKCSVCRKHPSKEVLVFNKRGATYLLLVCGRCIKAIEGGKVPPTGLKASRPLGIVDGRFSIEDVDSILYYFRDSIQETGEFVMDLDAVLDRKGGAEGEAAPGEEPVDHKRAEFHLPL